MPVVNYEIKQGVGVITLDNPPVNALSHVLREGLVNTITAAQTDASRALLIICQGRTFIAGADISEFGQPPRNPSLPDVMGVIENSAKPVISAMHGSALGGGFEIALSCHYRCALASASVGLPEVKLGLLPGAGGTQRVPRLAGVKAALDIITTGAPVSASEALELGLIDRLIEGDLLSGALDYAHALLLENSVLRRVRDMSLDPASISPSLFDDYRQLLARRARGQMAPQNIVSCIEAAVNLPMDEGLAKERELFIECRDSSQSAAMRHLFFAERQAARIRGVAPGIAVRPIHRVGIIGGGTMGGGIAMCFANAGIAVTLLEISDQALQRGMDIVARNYARTVKKGRLSQAQAAQRQALIQGSTDYGDLATADMVIEAVFENLEIKQAVFRQLDAVCKQGAILATNTSYQDVNAIAAVTERPADVIGLHFFSPANVMKLLEVVQADDTAADVVATAMAIARTIGKVPVLSRVCYGFIGNRMLRQYGREAQLCLIQGSTPEQIDRVMVDWGMAMGPLAVGDLAGLDIGYKARQALSPAERGPTQTYCIADALVELGRLGQKSGVGYYCYDPQSRARSSDPQVLEVIETQARAQGIERCELSDDEILNRLTMAWINEGFKILEEGIAQRPGDIDVVYAFGYGFPAYRGGPMFYADTLGLKQVLVLICDFRERYGEQYWAPSQLLQELVRADKTLAQWAAEQP